MKQDPLSPLEAAIGMPLGVGEPIELPRVAGLAPSVALEEATLPALRAGPCWVAFSGGRDSSLVLAAAANMARRAGLPPPIALTFRFPDVPSADETAWQERVIAHLRIEQWERVVLHDELDLLGDVATELLGTIGPYWPANSHFSFLLAQRAGSGSLLTGEGGDDLFSWWRWQRAASVLSGGRQVRRRPRDLAAVTLAVAPRPLRRMHERRSIESLPWLTASAGAAHRRAVARDADVPWRWDRQLAWVRATKDVTLSEQTLVSICDLVGMQFRAPLLDLRFLGALASAGGAGGLGSQRATLTALFTELLPLDVLARSDKATFNGAFFGPRVRAFAQDWSGTGVDEALVKANALREAWMAPSGDGRSACLLHRAWIRSAKN